MENLYQEFRDIDFDIMNGMSKAIQNIGKNQYPYVQLNQDESISFFDEKDNLNQKLMKLEYDVFTEILKKEAKEGEYNIIENKSNKVLEKFDHEDTGLVEYKINLTPRNLDSILKKISTASFYKGDNSVLNLYENKLSDSKKTIKLFPVHNIGNGKYIVRAAGCQMTEMPSIQLLKLMQDFLGREKVGELNANFHWIPKPLESLGFDRNNIVNVVNSIFEKDNPLSENKKIRFKGSEGIENYVNKPSSNSSIKMTPMNEDSRNFYLKYGNIGEEELNQCESLEVDTEFFLKETKDELTAKQKSTEDWFKEHGDESAKSILEKINNGVNYLNQTIESLKNHKLPSQDISDSKSYEVVENSIKK